MSEDLALILDAALEAGRIALLRREQGLKIRSKAGGSPVTDADEEIDAMLQARLIAARPDYGWLSEEIADYHARLAARRVFVVDPIDGTASYLKGRPYFAVSIAVVEDGRPVAGVVHAPAMEETYQAALGGGARLNGAPVHASKTTDLHDAAMLGDEKMFRHPSWPTPWPPMRVETRNSIAYRMCLVASGAFDAAVALNDKNEWDLAAADLICGEAGAVTTDHRGRPFAYNRPVPRQRGLICAAPGVHPLILQQLEHIHLGD